MKKKIFTIILAFCLSITLLANKKENNMEKWEIEAVELAHNEITWKHKGANYDIILDSKNDILIEGYNLFLTGKYPYLYGIFTKNKKCYAFLINLETKETLIENNENQIKISEKLFYLKKEGIQFQELNNFMDINGGQYSDESKLIKLRDLLRKNP